MAEVLVFVSVCTARNREIRNFASSSDEYVDVGISVNLGFGLFKSACRVEIELGVEREVESTLLT